MFERAATVPAADARALPFDGVHVVVGAQNAVRWYDVDATVGFAATGSAAVATTPVASVVHGAALYVAGETSLARVEPVCPR